MAIAKIEMIIYAYLSFILLFTGSGTTNDVEINRNIRQIERMKRSAPTLSDRTFKKVIVYNDAITTLSTSTWPRYVMEIIRSKILHQNLFNRAYNKEFEFGF